MATLPGFVLRLSAVCALAIALTALCPKEVRAQTPDSDDAVKSAVADGTDSDPGDSDAPAAHPAAVDRTESGSAVKADSSAKSDSATTAKPDSSTETNSAGSGRYELHAALKSLDLKPRSGDTAFDHASELFPAFCKDWERKLHDRELNNLENMSWKDQSGWKTGTYLGYSPIKSCSCKRSTGGVPIGELTYQETEYYLTGRTVEEARHAQPKPVGITNTTEIFRWDKTKWDDGR